MEKFYHCPICTSVPEIEIYQCPSGHILCNLCFSKVSDRNCPQCRTPFGPIKIRARVLEEILDTRHFVCRFEDEGCPELLKRGEITSHANSCSFNPDMVALCKIMGREECSYKFETGVSKSEIIEHFTIAHNRPLINVEINSDCELQLKGKAIKNAFSQTLLAQDRHTFPTLFSPGGKETSPLFLMELCVDQQLQTLSGVCIKVWDSGSLPSAKYNAEFTLLKRNDTFPPNLANPFPISWKLKVYTVKEVAQIVDTDPHPVTVSVPLLEKFQFGSDDRDYFRFRMNRVQ